MNISEGELAATMNEGLETEAPDDNLALLLGTVQDWFASALRAVLEPEGFTLYRAHSSEEVLSFVARMQPDLVVVDQDLPPIDPPELCRMLRDGPLPRHVPLLYHFSRSTPGGEDVEMLQSGVWGTLEGPVRPSLLVAQLRRYRKLSEQMVKASEEQQYVDPETELLTLTGLMRVLPTLSGLAQRRGRPLTFTALGPTEPGAGRILQQQRQSTARLCRRNLRTSDFVGWLHDGDLAVVTYGTSQDAGQGLARRLNELADAKTRAAELRYTLSAGIIELEPSRRGPEARNGGGSDDGTENDAKLETLHALAAAQTALRKARDAGGGIRVAELR